jgi:hypothetical protein
MFELLLEMIAIFNNESELNVNFQRYQTSYLPFVISRFCLVAKEVLFESLKADSTRVDVSCLSPDTNEFSGNPYYRESVKIKVCDFIEGFETISKNSGEQHWISTIGLNLYLSQCCLYAKDRSNIQIEDISSSIFEERPSFLQNVSTEIEAINLWMNIQFSQSTLHYDANHNMLTILQGAKRVILISPELTSEVDPVNVFSENPNHSNLSFKEVCDRIEKTFSRNPRYNGKFYDIVLTEGQSVFIPEGWWHQVESSPCTAAVNYWFSSKIQNELVNNEPLYAYILRAITHRLAISNAKQVLSTLPAENYFYRDNLSEQDFVQILQTSYNSEETQLLIINCDFQCMKDYWLPFSSKVSVRCLTVSVFLFLRTTIAVS